MAHLVLPQAEQNRPTPDADVQKVTYWPMLFCIGCRIRSACVARTEGQASSITRWLENVGKRFCRRAALN